MNARRQRGACRRLSAPMQPGEGLLVRLLPEEPIAPAAFARLCAAAQRHGNGLIEISARGSLQVRGLTALSAPRFAADASVRAIAGSAPVALLTDPLPQDPHALVDCSEL